MTEAATQLQRIREHFLQSADVKRRTLEASLEEIIEATRLIVACYRADHKVMICGNGGSAADAQHMAAEFVNRLRADLDRPGLPALALTTDTSFLTSYANDVGYEGVFERQVSTLGRADDVLIAISTSGRSRNVILAVEAANRIGIRTIGLIGEGGVLSTAVDVAIVVPSRDTQYVQEALLTVEHVICATVENAMFEPGTS